MTTQKKQKGKLVPKLRFKCFDGEWGKDKLGNRANSISSGKIKPNEEGEYDVYGSTGIIGKSNEYTHQGDYLLVARVGANAGLINRVNGKFAVTDNTLVIDLKDKAEVAFCESFLIKFNLNKLIFGSGQPLITGGLLKSIDYVSPTLPEQQKISSFLSSVDEKLSQLTRKKELLAQYKKGVMQQLFSGKLRFKDENGKEFPKWKERKISDVLFEHKLKSTGKEEVFSVSVHKGLVNQVEHLGRVFAAKNTDNYNLVKPNDIVYTKSPTGDFPLGIIKQSRLHKEVIVSPLYGIFTPETRGLGYLLHVYFESPINVTNYLASIIQKGAKNTINITNTTFLSKSMKLPVSKEEQEKIGEFLSSIDTKIESITTQISQTQSFKKGLLQQMFV
jgi:type I restriction enzyme S subunit